MAIKHVMAKFGSMRKEQDWIVYPGQEEGVLVIQSDTRMCRIDIASKTGRMTKSHKNGAGFLHLRIDKCEEINISEDLLRQFIDAKPVSGQEIGPGVTIA